MAIAAEPQSSKRPLRTVRRRFANARQATEMRLVSWCLVVQISSSGREGIKLASLQT